MQIQTVCVEGNIPVNSSMIYIQKVSQSKSTDLLLLEVTKVQNVLVVVTDDDSGNEDVLVRDHLQISLLILTRYSPVFFIYTPWKHQKTFRFSDVFRGYR